jgi:hypothetical protein
MPVMTSATLSPLATSSGATCRFQATPLIDQMYFAMSPVRCRRRAMARDWSGVENKLGQIWFAPSRGSTTH